MTREQALKIFSKGLAAFIHRNGYTQDQLGELLGCGRANINKIKSGKNFPSMERVFTLVEKGMKLEEIFGADLAEKLVEGLAPEPTKTDAFKSPEFRQGVIETIADLIQNGKKPVEILK